MMLEQWKLKLNEAFKDYGDDMNLSPKLQIAIATGMMPSDIQEIIFQHGVQKDSPNTNSQ